MAIYQHIEGLPEGCFYPSTFNLPEREFSEWYYESLKKEADKDGKGVDEVGDGRGELVDDHSMWEDMDDDIINDVAPDCAEKVGGCHLERRV